MASTTEHAEYTERAARELCLLHIGYAFRVFRVFRGCLRPIS